MTRCKQKEWYEEVQKSFKFVSVLRSLFRAEWRRQASRELDGSGRSHERRRGPPLPVSAKANSKVPKRRVVKWVNARVIAKKCLQGEC